MKTGLRTKRGKIMREIVLVGAVRTPIGDFGGSMKNVPPLDLAEHVIKEVMARSKARPEWVNKVIFGCCFAPIEQNVARNAAFRAGIPKEAPGFTINSTCGSSLQAIISAIQSISCGESDLVLAGGVESMSQAPYVMTWARWGQRLKHAEVYDLVWRGMQEPHIGVGMGLTAENLAEQYGISRQEQDSFALLSHQRAARAVDEGKFVDEIAPVTLHSRKGKSEVFNVDEHVRPEASLENLAKLP
ncbi:MAG: beta-ketoacyl synthase N-terminal-like domain-containing protein, partial [Desulfatiglandaceae bacterium]